MRKNNQISEPSVKETQSRSRLTLMFEARLGSKPPRLGLIFI